MNLKIDIGIISTIVINKNKQLNNILIDMVIDMIILQANCLLIYKKFASLCNHNLNRYCQLTQ